jgi:hypothetical protein
VSFIQGGPKKRKSAAVDPYTGLGGLGGGDLGELGGIGGDGDGDMLFEEDALLFAADSFDDQ